MMNMGGISQLLHKNRKYTPIFNKKLLNIDGDIVYH